jgi:exopolyphosphatase/guanosine-5'-triphosphate,3'-diphosphate pyrophosphatase
MTLCLIDVGSNTVRCLIVRREGDEVVPVLHRLRATRLGARLPETGRIAEENLAATAAAVARFIQCGRSEGTQRFEVVGTAALRQASNAVEAKAAIEAAAGMLMRVLSEEEEAGLTFTGALGSLPEVPETATVLIVDVGGLSLELAVGSRSEISWCTSLPLGCRALTEAFLRSDPPSREERRRLAQHVSATLAAVRPPRAAPGMVIAFGGTPTTLVALREQMETYDGDRVHGSRLRRAEIAAWAEGLAGMNLAARRVPMAVDPDRAEVIIAGALLLAGVLDWAGAKDCLVSDRGLLTGLAMSVLEKREPG